MALSAVLNGILQRPHQCSLLMQKELPPEVEFRMMRYHSTTPPSSPARAFRYTVIRTYLASVVPGKRQFCKRSAVCTTRQAMEKKRPPEQDLVNALTQRPARNYPAAV
ncbi:hypothetical protein NDU88_005367 [Pleurodeles waltl]|uniref:Uncharacterized protein n=1 Tax=Pleurodeles waltl TaxID=8319 RepID=A0AAV7LX51_PLEWA|nr:hypothetical protein NDU88_005367 [Pleurodeles waltl]